MAGDAVEDADGELYGDEVEEAGVVDGATAVAEDKRLGEDGAEETDALNGGLLVLLGVRDRWRNGRTY